MKTAMALDWMRLETDGKLGWITFTRPERLNAMNNDCTRQLNQLAQAVAQNADLRVVVIRGSGRAFCTGIDLKELAAGEIQMTYHHRWERALRRFETMETVIVVAMHGYCLGGALQLALAADIRISTPDCRIGLPAIKESLVPGLSVWRLPRTIGWGRAKHLILSGAEIDGITAHRIGLVDHIAPREDFDRQVAAIAGDYIAACSAGMRMSKLLLASAFDQDFDSARDAYFALQERAMASPDAREASRAYLAGETPEWQ
jgi:enoyl-CoA hydratase